MFDKINRLHTFIAGFLLALLLALGVWCCQSNAPGKPLSNAAEGVSMHDAKLQVPVKAYDKGQLKDRGVISKKTVRDPGKEVTAAATIKDDSGTRHVAAELDVKTGVTQLVEKRPFMETMSRWEAGVGCGLYEGDTAQGAQVRWTFGRAGMLYGSTQVEAFQVDRVNERHPWIAMIWATGRF